MLEEKITADYKQAMKDKDTLRSSTLSFLRAQLKNVLIEKKKDKLDDSECLPVLKKLVKQRQEGIEQFEKGGRQDLVEKEKNEMAILKSYLPPEMPKEELKKIVEEAIQEAGATSIKDMGKVMKIVTSKTAGRADGKTVSDLVKQILTQM
ncbi:MAG: GatB/YqeY domain-containing protein [Candidatus Omnitrophota bacterium]